MAYADYQFYTTEYGGKVISADDFPGLANRAAAYIDAITSGAAARATGTTLYQVQMANCALAENMQYENYLDAASFSAEGQVSSESVGSWSKSYSTKSVSSTDIELLDRRRKEIILLYLSGTGLVRILRPVKRCCH